MYLFSTFGQTVLLNCTLFFLLQGIKETALHLSVRLEERSSLALVDFLCQNRSDPYSDLFCAAHRYCKSTEKKFEATCVFHIFIVQQLSGEENIRGEYSPSLQRHTSQTRITQVASQSKGFNSHRYFHCAAEPPECIHTTGFKKIYILSQYDHKLYWIPLEVLQYTNRK